MKNDSSFKATSPSESLSVLATESAPLPQGPRRTLPDSPSQLHTCCIPRIFLPVWLLHVMVNFLGNHAFLFVSPVPSAELARWRNGRLQKYEIKLSIRYFLYIWCPWYHNLWSLLANSLTFCALISLFVTWEHLAFACHSFAQEIFIKCLFMCHKRLQTAVKKLALWYQSTL